MVLQINRRNDGKGSKGTWGEGGGTLGDLPLPPSEEPPPGPRGWGGGQPSCSAGPCSAGRCWCREWTGRLHSVPGEQRLAVEPTVSVGHGAPAASHGTRRERSRTTCADPAVEQIEPGCLSGSGTRQHRRHLHGGGEKRPGGSPWTMWPREDRRGAEICHNTADAGKGGRGWGEGTSQ